MGISILPPDINRSEGKFTVDGQAIRYGMAAVKGIGKPVMEAIVEERSANGPFRSLKDFAERLSGKRSQQADRRELYQGGRIRLLRRDEKAAHVRLRQCAR